MDSKIFNVTPEEFKQFHGIDRKLYSLLVHELAHDPSECLKIMGFWLWLERRGSSNLIMKIWSLPLNITECLVHEAVVCLKCLDDHFPVDTTEIPMTRHISNDDKVSRQFFLENRLMAFHGVQKLVSEVCIPALSDLMEIARHAGYQANLTQNQVVLPVLAAPGLSADSLMGSFSRMRISGDAGLAPSQGESRFERTIVVTFSKGYPVSEAEIWSFFFNTQGNDCIESIYMQEVGPGEQALYARVIFKNASYIRSVLHGLEKAKFSIKGKHVWMRKFIPRNDHSSP